MFKRNLHFLDRLLRLAVGIVCLYFGIFDPSFIQQQIIVVIIVIFGVVNLLAAAMAYCPLYGLTRLSTYKEKTE